MSFWDWSSSRGSAPSAASIADMVQSYPVLAARVQAVTDASVRWNAQVRQLAESAAVPDSIRAAQRAMNAQAVRLRVQFFTLRDEFRKGVRDADARGQLDAATLASLRDAGLAALGIAPLVILAAGAAVGIAAGVTGALWIAAYRGTSEEVASAEALQSQNDAAMTAWRDQVARQQQAVDSASPLTAPIPLPPLPVVQRVTNTNTKSPFSLASVVGKAATGGGVLIAGAALLWFLARGKRS